MLEIEVWKYWNIVEFPKISIKMQKLKTFCETQIVIPVKEIIQHFTR